MNEASSPSFSRDYAAVREGGAGLIDLSARGRIAVGGSEAAKFLNGLVTNDVKALAPLCWIPAIFPNVQGRILASVRIMNLGDQFLIDTEVATYEIVLNLLSRFTLAGDFRVTDQTEEIASLSVQGRRAGEILRSIFGEAALPVQQLPWEPANISVVDWEHGPVTIICDTHTGEMGYDLFVTAAQITDLRQTLMDAGAVLVTEDTVEMLRIEAGIPRYSVDIDSATVVNESSLDYAVSYTKGCYIGQEIVVRIKHRGHVAKKLTSLIFPDESFEIDDRTVYAADGQQAGRVTSWLISPHLGYTVALAYIKFDYLKMQTPIQMQVGNRTVKGIVCSEPNIVRGGWFELIDSTPFPISSGK